MSDTMLLGVLRMPVNENDPLCMAQFVQRARQAADRIESDADEITRLQSEVERLRGRCGELEEVVGMLRHRIIDSMSDKRAAARNWPDAGVGEMLGRSASEDQEVLDSTDYAQRLRQQAAESESQQEENDD